MSDLPDNNYLCLPAALCAQNTPPVKNTDLRNTINRAQQIVELPEGDSQKRCEAYATTMISTSATTASADIVAASTLAAAIPVEVAVAANAAAVPATSAYAQTPARLPRRITEPNLTESSPWNMNRYESKNKMFSQQHSPSAQGKRPGILPANVDCLPKDVRVNVEEFARKLRGK